MGTADWLVLVSTALSIILLASTIASKPWNWWSNHRKRLQAEMASAAKVAADMASEQLLHKLTHPNGGNSLHDIARHVDKVDRDNHDFRIKTAAELEAIRERTQRIENTLDKTLVPKQAQIQKDIETYNREAHDGTDAN